MFVENLQVSISISGIVCKLWIDDESVLLLYICVNGQKTLSPASNFTDMCRNIIVCMFSDRNNLLLSFEVFISYRWQDLCSIISRILAIEDLPHSVL